MGWQDDLMELLNAPDEDPVEDILRSGPGQAAIGALTSDPADFLFKTLDAPASVIRGGLGTAANLAAGQGMEGVGLEQGQRSWDIGMQNFRQADLGAAGILKGPAELAINVVADPTSWTGFGLAGKGARVLKTAANQAVIRGAGAEAAALRAGAAGLGAAQAINDLPGQIGVPMGRAAGRVAKRGIERVAPTAFQESAKSMAQRRGADLDNLATAMKTVDTTPTQRPYPLQIGDVTSSSTPPVMPNIHPKGSAPASIYQRGLEAWNNLWGDGGKLGIIQSTDSPIEAGMWAVPDKVRLTEAHLDNMAAIGSSIMQNITEQGGVFLALERANTGMRQLQDRIIGQYGAGVQPYLPMIYERMKANLGEDADMLMPSSRFLLPWGWAPGFEKTRGTALRSVNELVRKGTMTPEDALTRLETEFPARKSSPQVVEGAAAMGAAFLTALHNADDEVRHEFRPGGAWFPQRVTGEMKVAVPQTFTDQLWGEGGHLKMDPNSPDIKKLMGVDKPFGSVREAWNTYMRTQFGGALDDAELDSLARMSTDLTYDTYVNAANDVSGGAEGANRIAAAGLDAEGNINIDPFREVATKFEYGTRGNVLRSPGDLKAVSDKYSKRGAVARDKYDIGSDYAQGVLQRADRDGRLEFDKNNGRAKQLSLWRAQAYDLLGREITPEDIKAVAPRSRTVNKDTIKIFLEANDLEPIKMVNPVGGLLPNLTGLIGMINYGKGLYVSPLSKNAADWYPSAAKEVVAIAGAGNYEKASIFLDFIAVTSASTEVSENAEFALRALSEWDYGYDDAIRNKFGMTGSDFDRVRKTGLLHADMNENHKTKIEQAATEYQARREVANRTPQAVAGGTKTFNYGGSFLVNVWRNMIDEATKAGGKAMQGARKAFDDALEIFTVDRHQSRVENLATAVNEIEEFLLRERGFMASKVAGVSGEEGQAAMWYWSRDKQGFARMMRPDSDIVYALRKVIEDTWNEAAPDPGRRIRAYHGSGMDKLDTIEAEPGYHQVDYASAQLGAFFTPRSDEAATWLPSRMIHGKRDDHEYALARIAEGTDPDVAARRYTGERVYEADVKTQNPHHMTDGEMRRFYTEASEPTYSPDDEFLGDAPTKAAADAAAFKQQLQEAGHDGIIVWKGTPKVQPDGTINAEDLADVKEIVSFKDVPVGLNPNNLRHRQWAEIVNMVQRELGLDETEAVHEVYSMMQQDIFLRLIHASLQKPAVREALMDRGITPTLPALQGDTLGLIQRGAAGLAPDEWPDPLTKGAQDLWSAAEGAAATGQPMVMTHVGGDWVAGENGIIVPIREGGSFKPGQAQTARKAMEKLLTDRNISELTDHAFGPTFDENLAFFTRQVGDRTQVWFGARVDTEAQAAALEAAMGGRSRGDLRKAFGEAVEPKPRFTPEAEDARRRGFTLAEMDVTNPTSFIYRRFKKPIMDHYAELSLEEAAESQGMSLDDLNLPDWPDRMAAKQMDFDPRLTLQQNELLRTKLKDGRTYKQVWDETAGEAHLDMQALKEAGVTWGPYANAKQRIEAAGGDAKLEKIIKKWTDDGIDISRATDPNMVASRRVQRLADADAGIKRARPTTYDLFRAAWGEQALASLKYHTGNLSGGMIQNMMAGHFAWPPFRDIYSVFKALRGGTDEVTRNEALESLHATKIARYWGLDAPPTEVLRGGGRAMLMGDSEFGPSAIGELVGRATRNPELGRKAGWLPQANNDLGLAIDSGVRGSLWEQVFDDDMWRMLPAWESEVRSRGAGIPGFEFDTKQGINAPSSFQPDALKDHLMDLGFQDGVAEHLMRQFVEVRGLGLKTAKEELDRVQFYGSRTNLDEWVSKVAPFHYWFSRALRFYGEETLRHPFLLLNYMRLTDGIDDAQHDPGLSARQKGFIRLMGTPLGFSLLMNPDALFGAVRVFGMDTFEREQGGDKWSDPPSGYTPLGGALDWIKQRGFGIYPWFDGTMNLMGAYGNDFEPDLLGIRHKALVGAAVNFSRAHLGFDPVGAPYADAMGQARYAVSSFVASFGPDWLAQPVTPRAGGSSQEAALDTLIESVIQSSNPGMTNGDLLQIMSDPDSPQYESAYRTVSEAGLAQQLLNFTAPVQFRMRHDATDVRRAQVSVVADEAKKQGVAPYELAPTPQDLDFQARYKALTGKEWEPTDYSDAKLKHDLNRAPDEAKVFILQENEYNNLGTPEQKAVYQTYTDLLDGTDTRSAGRSEDARRELANQYLFRIKGAGKAVDEVRAQRAQFVAAHPEFAEFKSWQSRMFDIKTSFGGNLAEYRRQASEQNPNAARYFADQWDWITRNLPEDEWDEQLERSTSNANAYLAITGKPQLRSIQGPIPGVPPVDLTIPNIEAQAQNMPTGAPYNWSQDLAGMSRNIGVSTRFGF